MSVVIVYSVTADTNQPLSCSNLVPAVASRIPILHVENPTSASQQQRLLHFTASLRSSFFAVGFHADAETDWKHNVVIFFEGTDYKGKFIILVSSPKDFQ